MFLFPRKMNIPKLNQVHSQSKKKVTKEDNLEIDVEKYLKNSIQ
jgi:hypothetical protein